jgi:ferredoxin-NADP reductase
VRATKGAIPAGAQQGLKDTLATQGYLLACLAKPTEDLEITTRTEGLRQSAVLEELARLSDDVLRVRLRPAEQFAYRAGQFLTLISPAGVARSYSLASLPHEPLLELHVRLLRGGRMSEWLAAAQPGTAVEIQGPSGHCFYTPGRPEQTLLLAGTGTGLAPLYGIVRDALAQGHTGAIRLFHGARSPRGLYLQDELRTLAEEHAHLEYRTSTLDEGTTLEQAVLGAVGKPTGVRSYLCGAPDTVQSLRMKLFMAGQSFKDILADAFVPAAGQ